MVNVTDGSPFPSMLLGILFSSIVVDICFLVAFLLLSFLFPSSSSCVCICVCCFGGGSYLVRSLFVLFSVFNVFFAFVVIDIDFSSFSIRKQVLFVLCVSFFFFCILLLFFVSLLSRCSSSGDEFTCDVSVCFVCWDVC